MSKMSEANENESTTSAKSLISNSAVDCMGKVLVKAQFKEDIRRVPIHNEDITYDELVLMMQRIFRGQLKPEDDIVIKYQDEDGDMVTIFDSSDLSFAIAYCRVLKLKITVKEKADEKEEDVADKLKNIGIREIRKELKELRDRATRLLDVLDAEIENKTIVDKPRDSISLDSTENKSKFSNGPTSFGTEQTSSFVNQSQSHAPQPSLANQQLTPISTSTPQHHVPSALNQSQSGTTVGPPSLQQSHQQSTPVHHAPPPVSQGTPMPGGGASHNISMPGGQQMPQPGGLGGQQQQPGSNMPPPGSQVGGVLPPPPSSGMPPQSGGYPAPTSTPSSFTNYSNYGGQYGVMAGNMGYPPSSTNTMYGRPPPTGSVQPPPPGTQPPPPNPMQQPPPPQSAQPGQQQQQQQQQSYQGYGTSIYVPPPPSSDQNPSQGSHPPPPGGSNAAYNQYRMPTSAPSGGNLYGRPQMGYK